MDKDKTIQKTASCSIGLDPKTGSPTIFDANGKEASVFQILGYLYVAGADSLEDIFAGSNNEELIAEKLENELEYPGQIKVNVIREVRSVEYAK